MKKVLVYPVLALLILSLVACAVLFMERQNLKLQLETAQEQAAAALSELDLLTAQNETLAREREVTIGAVAGVRTVLSDTLKQLDALPGMDSVLAAAGQTPEPQVMATLEPTEPPKATAAPKATETPRAAEKAQPAAEAQATPTPLLTVGPTPTPSRETAPAREPAAKETPAPTEKAPASPVPTAAKTT